MHAPPLQRRAENSSVCTLVTLTSKQACIPVLIRHIAGAGSTPMCLLTSQVADVHEHIGKESFMRDFFQGFFFLDKCFEQMTVGCQIGA